MAIKFISEKLNEFMNDIIGTKDVDTCLAIDTDSVGGESLIYVNGRKMRIDDFYNNLQSMEKTTLSGGKIKNVSNIKTMTYEGERVIERSIKYAYAHEVEKEMFDLEIDGKGVRVTADHSIIVSRDSGELISVKPANLQSNDKIINICDIDHQEAIKGNNFTCKSLGVKKEIVYDLEVEDTHTFFANDILVHNSCYLNFGPVVDKFFPGKTDAETTDILDKIAKEKIQPFIDKSYHELAEYMNSFNMEWFMKREAIARTAVFVQKKKYFMSILDDEGVRMKEPKLKVIGLEAVRSSTPEVCRDALKSIMKTILAKEESDVQDEVAVFKEKFNNAHVLDICFPRGVSNIEKWMDSTNKGFKSGTPIAVRGSILFNKLMKEKDPTYETIKSGDKIKFLYIKVPNKFKSNVISLPNELPGSLGLEDGMVDKDIQFEKTYLAPVDSILKIIGWSAEKKNSLASFF